MNKTNCYIIQNGNMYDIYYQNEFLYKTNSIEYFNADVPVYKKGDWNDKKKYDKIFLFNL